jgi:hypothetical protein
MAGAELLFLLEGGYHDGLADRVRRLVVERSASQQPRGYTWTALHAACKHGCGPAVVSVLLENGADVNALNQFQQTPLHCAVIWGAGSEVVGLLLDKGAHVNAYDGDGRTALSCAVARNSNNSSTNDGSSSSSSNNSAAGNADGKVVADGKTVVAAANDDNKATASATSNANSVVIGLLLAAGADAQVEDPESAEGRALAPEEQDSALSAACAWVASPTMSPTNPGAVAAARVASRFICGNQSLLGIVAADSSDSENGGGGDEPIKNNNTNDGGGGGDGDNNGDDDVTLDGGGNVSLGTGAAAETTAEEDVLQMLQANWKEPTDAPESETEDDDSEQSPSPMRLPFLEQTLEHIVFGDGDEDENDGGDGKNDNGATGDDGTATKKRHHRHRSAHAPHVARVHETKATLKEKLAASERRAAVLEEQNVSLTKELAILKELLGWQLPETDGQPIRDDDPEVCEYSGEVPHLRPSELSRTGQSMISPMATISTNSLAAKVLGSSSSGSSKIHP